MSNPAPEAKLTALADDLSQSGCEITVHKLWNTVYFLF